MLWARRPSDTNRGAERTRQSHLGITIGSRIFAAEETAFTPALYHCVAGMGYLMPCVEMKELEAVRGNYVERRQTRAATISERRKMPASWVQTRAAYSMQLHRRNCPICRSSLLPRSTCLVALAEAALRIHQKTIEAKKVHLEKDLPESLTAQVHSGEILQLVSNLIANALDALPIDGTLCIRLRRRRSEAHFVVADNGHGIPKSIFAHIFEPFFTTKDEVGTGLGLALSKRIVEGHRGRIRVRSSLRPGKSGTIFKISLPV
ncbi:MAG: hypothetical protein QOH35_5421 [Acidobacteriaceae bacterium]|nr:hypothetical protein [Acidobacteriaceae bacterium]